MDWRAPRSQLTGFAVATASVAAITLANFGLRELVPVVSTGVVYLLAVLLVSSRWGLWLGLYTAVASALAWNWFHIPPTGRFSDRRGRELARAWRCSWSPPWSRARSRTPRNARAREGRGATGRGGPQRRDGARMLLGGGRLDESLQLVAQRIAQALGLSSLAVELTWVDGDERRRALPLIVDGDRIGTVLAPRDADGRGERGARAARAAGARDARRGGAAA